MYPGRPARKRSPLRVALVGVAVLVLVGGLAWGVWWWRHPDVFEPAGDVTIGSEDGEQLRARSLPRHYDLMVSARERHGSVTLLDADPHFVENSADATVSFHFCVVRPPDTFFIGVDGDLAAWCSEVTDLEDAVLPLKTLRPAQTVVMTIESAQPGELRIDGIDLTYRSGLQVGTQRVGPEFRFRIG